MFVGRAGTCAPAPTPQPRPQAVGEDDPCAHCAQREAAAHTAHMLQRQPAARRAHEGAAGRDDRPQPASYPRLVSEQTLQGQEEVHAYEAAPAAAAQRQNRKSLIYSRLVAPRVP